MDQIDQGAADEPIRVRRESAAEHVGRGFEPLRAACRRAVERDNGPHHVAHYTAGVRDFDLDVLDRAPLPAGTAPDRVRENCLLAERKLVLMLDGVDRSMREVRTGALIRTVLHTELGACFCDSVVPRQHITGVRLEPADDGPLSMLPGVRETDVALAELVTDARERLSEGTQNPGGWSTRKPGERTPNANTGAVAVDRATVLTGDPDGPIARACLAALHPRDLQYVAHFRNTEPVFTADCLGHDRLAPFFTQIDVADRRDFYGDFGAGFGVLASRLCRACEPAIGGLLHRVVLDVQQGALFYYRLGSGEYLFGVTLDQARVSDTDDKMAQLCLDCRT